MVNISESHETVLSVRMMFNEVFTEISMTRSPIYEKFLVSNTIFDPVEVHIRCFCSVEFDGRVSEGDGSEFVNLYWSR